VDTNHLQAETRAEDPSAKSTAGTREAGQPDATQVVLESGRVATVTSTSPSTPRTADPIATMQARLAQLDAARRAERLLDATRGAVVLAARDVVANGAGPESWRYDHLRRLLEQEAKADAAHAAALEAMASPLPGEAAR
jgi:hypothetical protein